MIRLLVITTLYPNANQFRHGIFVENRVKSLVASGEVEALVVAPVPWMPPLLLRLLMWLRLDRVLPLTEYRQYQGIPAEEVRSGIRVLHPRYPVIPKIGMYLTPLLLALRLLPVIVRLRRSGVRWDLIDSHYFYPDGVAVALVSAWLKLPFIVTARGSDINLIGAYALARRMMLWAAARSARNLCVSAELKKKMVSLGMAAENIAVVTNGIDETMFVAHPEPVRVALKKALPVGGYVIAAVGNLVELKGQHLVIDAIASLPDVSLLLIGDGEMRKQLQAQVVAAGLQERVRFLGNLPQAELVKIYNAVDLVCLASSREGCANVLLETQASGTPALATAVGGNGETVNSDEVGLLVHERSADGLRSGILAVRERHYDAARIRQLSRRFWYSSINSMLVQLYQSVIHQHQSVTQQHQSITEQHHSVAERQTDAPRESRGIPACSKKYGASHK